MSELTNETLRAIAHGNATLGIKNVCPMAEELLALRQAREAGDATNEDYREVVGLMKWVWKIIVCNELILSYIRRCDKPEAKAILEIVEGENA